MDAPAGGGPAAQPPTALRSLLVAGLEALRTRLELVAVELEIHLMTLVRMLVWVVAAVACVLLALAFGVTAMIVALWDSHRLLGLVGGGVAFLVLAGGFAWLGARSLRGRPAFLEGSLRELSEDQRRGSGGAP